MAVGGTVVATSRVPERKTDMGQSTDAHLFYGYCWEGEGDEPFGEGVDIYDISEESKKLFGVGIRSHCSCDYPVPYIYVSGTKTTAWRGSPQEIDPASMQVDTAEWDEKLADFVAHYNVSLSAPEWGEAPKGPGWFLVSNKC